MPFSSIIYSGHAVLRMGERSITRAEIEAILNSGNIIESYPTDTPFPSYLLLGWAANKPIHVVAADNQSAQETIVISVYEPNILRWENNFSKRK